MIRLSNVSRGFGISLLMTGAALAESSVFLGAGGGQSNLQDYSCTDCGSPIGSVDVGTDDPLLGHKNDISMLTVNFIYHFAM